jgi:transposase
MCLKPQPSQPIPPDTKALVGPMLDDDTVYRFVGDVLFEQFHDEDFADLYPNEGQPALSPVLLAFVLIFQALEDLSDRAAAFAVTFNVAWKYALHLPLSYPGFDPTVLSEFRQRLIRHKAEGRAFSAIFAQLKQLGFFKRKGIQHTDSIAVLTHHRLLHRIELCVETMRTTIKSLLHHDPDWALAHLPREWEERYAKRCKAERMKEDERQTLSGVVGDDGQWLLNRLDKDDTAHLRELRAVSTLRDVWAVHYERCADGHMRWSEGGERGGSQAIETPYDPDAHWATKRSKDWVGYKLHVTETDDPDMPHLITDIAITPAPEYDGTALPAIRERQAAHENLPGERYADSAYISGEHIVDGRTLGEDLIGPMRETVTPQSKIEGGFTHADFKVDFHHRVVICPAGHDTMLSATKDGGYQAIFPVRYCDACPLRPRCYMGHGKKSGRSLRFGRYYDETQAARKRQHTEEFKQAYSKHRSGVEGCLSALVRGQGCRTTRYDGQEKNHLRALLVGAAVNLARSAAWRAGYRPKKYPPTLGLAGRAGASEVAGATGAAMAA